MKAAGTAEICPLIPSRQKGDCPAHCRGCSRGTAPDGAEPAKMAAAVCPRVPQRLKYTCSGACPGCRTGEAAEIVFKKSPDVPG